MTVRTCLAGVLLCVLFVSSADARPKHHHRHHTVDVNKMFRPIPPGLQRIMAGGAGRVVNPTCDDVRAVVAWIGEAKAVEMALSAGATGRQIKDARRCLK
jgi:hypothetical protein